MVRKDWVNRLLGVCRATDCVSAGPRNPRNICSYLLEGIKNMNHNAAVLTQSMCVGSDMPRSYKV